MDSNIRSNSCTSCGALNSFGKSYIMNMGRARKLGSREFCRFCRRKKCKCIKSKVCRTTTRAYCPKRMQMCKKACAKKKKHCRKVCRRSRFGRQYYKGRMVHHDSKGRFIRKPRGVTRTGRRTVYTKQYLPRGAKTSTKKGTKKGTKPVKNTRGRVVGRRLSARSVYNDHGRKAVGKSYRILQKDGKYKTKVLKLRRNGSPYFATKFGKISHLNIPYSSHINGRRYDDMTGYKYSWPMNTYNIAPGGVRRPHDISLFSLSAYELWILFWMRSSGASTKTDTKGTVKYI